MLFRDAEYEDCTCYVCCLITAECCAWIVSCTSFLIFAGTAVWYAISKDWIPLMTFIGGLVFSILSLLLGIVLKYRLYKHDQKRKIEINRRANEIEKNERRAREENERRAKDENERREREENERKAREENERREREENERKAREENERRTKEENERRAREENLRMAREENKRKRAQEENERRVLHILSQRVRIEMNNFLHELKGNFPNNWNVTRLRDSFFLKAEIKTLFEDTWLHADRLGRDALNMTHDRLKVKAICLLHNPKLLQQYSRKASSMKNNQHGYIPLHGIKGQNKIITHHTELANAIWNVDPNFSGLDRTLNEEYLFHGTKLENIKSIMEHGFQLEYAAEGLYGRALYLAESSEKSDQYADEQLCRRNDNLCMIVTRTLLGRTYINEDNTKLSQLPCTRRNCFTQGCGIHSERFDIAVAGLDKRFREFLLFDAKQCYPHAFVFYNRVHKGSTLSLDGVMLNPNTLDDIVCCTVTPDAADNQFWLETETDELEVPALDELYDTQSETQYFDVSVDHHNQSQYAFSQYGSPENIYDQYLHFDNIESQYDENASENMYRLNDLDLGTSSYS